MNYHLTSEQIQSLTERERVGEIRSLLAEIREGHAGIHLVRLCKGFQAPTPLAQAITQQVKETMLAQGDSWGIWAGMLPFQQA